MAFGTTMKKAIKKEVEAGVFLYSVVMLGGRFRFET
jgi:hypothetical protein